MINLQIQKYFDKIFQKKIEKKKKLEMLVILENLGFNSHFKNSTKTI